MKFLEFLNADNDLHAFPLSRLVDIRYSSGTELEIFFDGAQPNGGNTKVSLAITSGEVDNVCKSLARVIQSHRGAVCRVADDVNSKYVMSGIASIADIEVSEYIAD